MSPLRTKPRVARISLLAVLSLVAIYLAGWKWASGGRTEFCAHTLQSRSQSEFLIPLTAIPIYRSGWTIGRYPLAEYLIKQGYWEPIRSEQRAWRIECHWNRQWRDGHSLLHRYLAWDTRLKEWTEQHPEIAAIVWPKVLKSLRSHRPQDRLAAEELLSAMHSLKSVEDEQTLWDRIVRGG